MKAPDRHHTVERCEQGLAAAEALSVTSGERAHWEEVIRHWKVQLEFAKKREKPDA